MKGIKEGDVLLLEHPVYGDRHVIAKAVKDATASTVSVVYFSLRDGWKDEVQRRTVRHVLGRLKGEDVPASARRIEDARLALEAALKTARDAYAKAVSGEIER